MNSIYFFTIFLSNSSKTIIANKYFIFHFNVYSICWSFMSLSRYHNNLVSSSYILGVRPNLLHQYRSSALLSACIDCLFWHAPYFHNTYFVKMFYHKTFQIYMMYFSSQNLLICINQELGFMSHRWHSRIIQLNKY